MFFIISYFIISLFLFVEANTFAVMPPYLNDDAYNSYLMSQQNTQNNDYNNPYKYSQRNNFEQQYIPYAPPPVVEEVKLPEMSASRRATKKEIMEIENLYRHATVTDKIPSTKFFKFSFIYVLPATVKDFTKKLESNSVFTESAIKAFETYYTTNVSNSGIITLNKRNFGVSFGYGKRIAYDVLSEVEAFFYQSGFIGDKQFLGKNTTFDMVFQENNQEITVQYNNVEYIQRTIGMHYNIYKEFPDLFRESTNVFFKKLVPYFKIGGGLTSRYHFLRLSQGILGNGGTRGGETTKQNYFNIRPSFGLGIGTTYQINDSLSTEFNLSTIQVVTDIQPKNFMVQMGFRYNF